MHRRLEFSNIDIFIFSSREELKKWKTNRKRMRYACIKVVLSRARLMEVFFNTKIKNFANQLSGFYMMATLTFNEFSLVC